MMKSGKKGEENEFVDYEKPNQKIQNKNMANYWFNTNDKKQMLGQGAYGTVYLCWDNNKFKGKLMAIKQIKISRKLPE